jgi:hypothetical protein
MNFVLTRETTQHQVKFDFGVERRDRSKILIISLLAFFLMVRLDDSLKTKTLISENFVDMTAKQTISKPIRVLCSLGPIKAKRLLLWSLQQPRINSKNQCLAQFMNPLLTPKKNPVSVSHRRTETFKSSPLRVRT